MPTRARPAEDVLRELGVLPMTFGRAIRSFRLCEEATLETYAARFGVSRQNLCDIEKERRTVSLSRAAEWARVLGISEQLFIEYALRSMLVQAGMPYDVHLVAPKKGPKKRRAA